MCAPWSSLFTSPHANDGPTAGQSAQPAWQRCDECHSARFSEVGEVSLEVHDLHCAGSSDVTCDHHPGCLVREQHSKQLPDYQMAVRWRQHVLAVTMCLLLTQMCSNEHRPHTVVEGAQGMTERTRQHVSGKQHSNTGSVVHSRHNYL
jgi:hypothetical protein